jgi:hypothetical protein
MLRMGKANDPGANCSISGQYLTRDLERAASLRGYLKAFRTGQGPEFTGNVINQPTIKTSN